MYAPSLSLADRPTRPNPAGRRVALWLGAPLVIALAVAPATPGVSVAAPIVMPAQTTTALPDPAVLSARLAKVPHTKLSKTAVAVTTTDTTATSLVDSHGARPMAPASTMKIFTTMTAVATVGELTRFTTKVVDAGSGRIVLVGGGDPLLTDKASGSQSYRPASLQKLAAATVAALKAAGTKKVTLGYDASLFTGPSFGPHWKARWKPTEARISALEINSGKDGWRAQSNPARFAANAFAARLKKAGISVRSVSAMRATSGAKELAAVQSASLGVIVKHTLKVSDNVAAETLSRHSAIAAGKPASFDGAAATVIAWAKAHGLWASGQVIHDGSGLSPSNRLTANTLAAAIRLALSDETFAPVIAGLPIAGVDGTLTKRFDDKSEKAGRKNVHAKTGTLRGVAGLVGYLSACSGQTTLAFAELDTAAQTVAYDRLYDWLDRTAATTITTSCG